MNWWGIYHNLMDRDWPPDVIGRMTIAQLMCLTDATPPDATKRNENLEDYEAAVQEAARKRNSWAD